MRYSSAIKMKGKGGGALEREKKWKSCYCTFLLWKRKKAKNMTGTEVPTAGKRAFHPCGFLCVCVCKCVCVLPGHVDSHILMRGSGQDAEQLVEDSGQEVDHHVALHCVKTLRGGKAGTLKEQCTFFFSNWPTVQIKTGEIKLRARWLEMGIFILNRHRNIKLHNTLSLVMTGIWVCRSRLDYFQLMSFEKEWLEQQEASLPLGIWPAPPRRPARKSQCSDSAGRSCASAGPG